MKPYYVYRPSQIYRRIKTHFQPSSAKRRWVVLPWGLRLMTNGMDEMSHSLQTTGINDLVATEVLFRLTDAGALAVDVGANVGYTTSILSRQAGKAGRVYSFEPHPLLFQELCSNIAEWKAHHADLAEVFTVNSAVSEREGQATLFEPLSFLENRGRSKIELEDMETEDKNSMRVETVSLDSKFKNEAIGILKVDVEGHEEQVFAGASDLLATKRIQNILFEEHSPYPAKTHNLLEEHGYRIFVIKENLLGPLLMPVSIDWNPPKNVPPNYIGTCDADLLRTKFKARGWKCLSSESRHATL